ncbi:hypothetical protein PENSUB_13551 [Penicillium subrubescens]|uniref:Uncharacterized protein n=1 Tax=Penicillium subrubescens TaxID=1316194 RepID=A0A1Q5SPP1_9EURO|nr:hypothetical protein PENSUB_13551 [Penicillium subrubescens]
MAQYDRKAAEYRCSKLFRDYKKWYDSLEGETYSSNSAGSSKPAGFSKRTRSSHTKLGSTPSTPTEHGRASSPVAKPESRRNRRVRFEPIERSQSPEPTQFSRNDRAQSVSSQ